METCINRYFIIDQQLLSSCDYNPFMFANGKPVYEVIRVIGGRPLFLREHLSRFFESLKQTESRIRESEGQLKQLLKLLIETNQTESGNIKLIAYTDEPGSIRKTAAWFIPAYYPSDEQYTIGVTLVSMDLGRKHPTCKVQDNKYKEAVAQRLQESKAYEVLLAHNENVTEGSKSNVFFVRDNCVFTAEDEQVLGGITRSKVIDLCSKHSIALFKGEIQLGQLSGFDACFLTGTSPKVLPISRIDQIGFRVPHQLIRFLMNEFDQMIKDNIENFLWDTLLKTNRMCLTYQKETLFP